MALPLEPAYILSNTVLDRDVPTERNGGKLPRVGNQAERIARTDQTRKTHRNITAPGSRYQTGDLRHAGRDPAAAIQHNQGRSVSLCEPRKQPHDIPHIDPVTRLVAGAAQHEFALALPKPHAEVPQQLFAQ